MIHFFISISSFKNFRKGKISVTLIISMIILVVLLARPSFLPFASDSHTEFLVFTLNPGSHHSDIANKYDENYFLADMWGSYGSGEGEFDYAGGVGAGPFGYIYVADTNNYRIQTFTNSGTFVRSWYAEFPIAIAVDPDGYYIYSCDGDKIYKYIANNGYLVRSWGERGSGEGQFFAAQGIALDPTGSHIYVADTNNHRIQKFDSYGNFELMWGTPGSGDGQFYHPKGVAVDSNGYVYVTDQDNNRVQKFDSNGNFITKWGGAGTTEGKFNFPMGIAVDSSNNVYIVDGKNNRVQKFDSNGNFITMWDVKDVLYGELGGSSFGNCITVDPYGNVYTNFMNHTAGYYDEKVLKFSLNTAPSLLSGQVSPSSGFGVTFTYSVNYVDVDNHAPEYIRVVVDGVSYDMVKQDPGDNDYTDGCIYVYQKSDLGLGVHEFHFEASDGYNPVRSPATGENSGPTVENTAPSLLSGQVNPQTGFGVAFSYTVNYVDMENDEPDYVRVVVDGVSYDMVKQDPGDNDYTDGCIYVYQKSDLGLGVHEFHFEASDGYNPVRSPATGENSGPTVNNKPVITGGVSPLTGNTTTLFTYTLNYTDPDNQEPVYVKVYIDGNPSEMVKQDPGDNDYTDGCIYEYSTQLGVGRHSYYFNVSDGIETVLYPASGEIDQPSVPSQEPTQELTDSTKLLLAFSLSNYVDQENITNLKTASIVITIIGGIIGIAKKIYDWIS